MYIVKLGLICSVKQKKRRKKIRPLFQEKCFHWFSWKKIPVQAISTFKYVAVSLMWFYLNQFSTENMKAKLTSLILIVPAQRNAKKYNSARRANWVCTNSPPLCCARRSEICGQENLPVVLMGLVDQHLNLCHSGHLYFPPLLSCSFLAQPPSHCPLPPPGWNLLVESQLQAQCLRAKWEHHQQLYN